MSETPRRALIILVWEALPHPRPWYVRLRWLLKIAWRAFRLKCVRFEELPEDDR